MNEIPPRVIEEAILEAFDHPAVPDLAPSTMEIDAAIIAVYELGFIFRNEVAIISLIRMERETGVDLLKLPCAHALAENGGDAYLVIRTVMGLLAYAWQLKTYGPSGTVLTVKEFEAAVTANRIPPSSPPESTQ